VSKWPVGEHVEVGRVHRHELVSIGGAHVTGNELVVPGRGQVRVGTEHRDPRQVQLAAHPPPGPGGLVANECEHEARNLKQFDALERAVREQPLGAGGPGHERQPHAGDAPALPHHGIARPLVPPAGVARGGLHQGDHQPQRVVLAIGRLEERQAGEALDRVIGLV
jgi:hypothetical protein